MRRALASLAILLLIGGCSGDGSPEPSAQPDTTVEELDDTTTPETRLDDPVFAPMADAVATVTLTTNLSGGGERPMLTWDPVDGASTYLVAILDADGNPYWAWRTSDTRVRVGGSDRSESAPGPRITKGMTWSVMAVDSSGIPIAVSARRPIEP